MKIINLVLLGISIEKLNTAIPGNFRFSNRREIFVFIEADHS